MPRPQSAILPDASESALFLVLEVEDRERNAHVVAEAAANVPAWTRRLAARPHSRLVSTVAFGPEMWDAISPGARPRGFTAFRAVRSGPRRAPATGGDVLLHAVAREHDVCFALARRLRGELGDCAAVREEVAAFRYLDRRDLTGFIDGTENPFGRARALVALIGSDDADFEGGSLVFTQRYVHDLAKWERQDERYQEQVFGRTKRDSRELREVPDTAHLARVTIEEDGEELEIVRHGLPYGTTDEHGLFFLAYTRDLTVPTRMLARMMGTAGDGRHDALLGYTRAVSGAHFFAPSLDTLRRLPS